MNIEGIQKSIINTSEVLFGEWKSSDGQISIYLHNGAFSSAVIHQVGGQITLDSSRIKCGINGITSHVSFIQRVSSFVQEKLQEHVVVFLYPSQGPAEEVWIFEATKMTAPWIKKAKENLKQRGQEDKQISEWSQKALKNFEIALKLQENVQGDTTDLQTAILQLRKNLFLLNIKQDGPLYLSSSKDIEELNKVVGIYAEAENIFFCLSEYVQEFEELSPCQKLITALIHENANNPIAAVPYYLDLAEKHSNPLPCLKKAALFVKAASDLLAYPHFLEKLDRDWLIQLSQKIKDLELEEWILHKDAVRMIFEESLRLMSARSTQIQIPTCFICFNAEEADVGKWLEQILVPDLDKVGIKPIFCFKDLGPGKELNNFQGLIRGADQVIVVCTPDLKKKCEERKKAPTGVAQEIRLAQERYNDPEKYETIFPLYLKGERKSSCPSVFLEPILGTKFTFLEKSNEASVFSYYASIFELVGAMRSIPRKFARKIKNDFLEKVTNALEGEINLTYLEEWRQKRPSRIEHILKANQERVSINTQMINLPLPPKNFTGREKEIETLHEACKSQHRVAVTGLGGIGKTALALKYGDEYKSHYQFIHFMPAGTSQLVIDGLLKLADDLHVPKSEKVEERLDWLKTMLGQFENEYLVIFDGVDQKEIFEDIEKYLPARGHCLLLTSRMPEQSKIRNYETIELDPFTLEEAIGYLLTALCSEEREQAKILAEKLGKLPLALTHAAEYIRNQRISITKYITAFNQYELELFKDEYLILTKEKKTILTTWKISIDAIEKDLDSPLGKEILEFFAFLGQAPIPLALVEDWCDVAHPSIFKPKLGVALGQLLGYSMIGSSLPDTYDVHSLVQSVTRFQMSEKKQQEIYDQAFELITQLISKWSKHDIKTWDLPKFCMPHGMALVEREELIAAVALSTKWRLVNALGYIYRILGDFRQALRLCQSSLVIAKNWLITRIDLKESRQAVSTSYKNIGVVHNNLANYDKALKFLQKAFKINFKMLGENHPDVAKSYNNIGWVYDERGDYDKAMEFCQKALALQLRILHESHPDVAESYDGIGSIYNNLTKYDKALEFFQKALKIRLQELGGNHPDVATSYNNVGLAYSHLGDYDKALEFYQNSLKIKPLVLNENHSGVAATYNNIGLVYSSRGDYAKALEFYQQALQIDLQVQGENHPDVAISYNNIGFVYQKLGNYEKSLEFHQKALMVFLQMLGENHPDVATSHQNIGSVYSELGNCKKAFESHQKALNIRLQQLGENHLDVAKSYNNICVLYKILGEYDKAIEFGQKALNIRLQLLGESHPVLATSYRNIGGVYYDLRDYEGALKNFQKAFIIWCNVYKQSHPDILDTLKTLIKTAEMLCTVQLNTLEVAYELCIKTLGIENELTLRLGTLIQSEH